RRLAQLGERFRRKRLASDVEHQLREVADAPLRVENSRPLAAARAEADELHDCSLDRYGECRQPMMRLIFAIGKRASEWRADLCLMPLLLDCKLLPSGNGLRNTALNGRVFCVLHLQFVQPAHRIAACSRSARPAASDAGSGHSSRRTRASGLA